MSLFTTTFVARHPKADYRLDIRVITNRLVPIFAEQYFVPRFILIVRNTGRPVSEGSIHFSIVRSPELANAASIEAGFVDIGQALCLSGFLSGALKVHFLRFPGTFLEPGSYMLRARLLTHRQSVTPRAEFASQMETLSAKLPRGDVQLSLESLQSHGVDLDHVSIGQKTADLAMDWRWLELVKVYPFASAVSALVALYGLLFAIAKWLLSGME